MIQFASRSKALSIRGTALPSVVQSSEFRMRLFGEVTSPKKRTSEMNRKLKRSLSVTIFEYKNYLSLRFRRVFPRAGLFFVFFAFFRGYFFRSYESNI